ncbi:tyrosine-type recombinase/integrase [Paenibacillus sp. WC2504]|uniref:tyrosine-type recombinase/integrase n=1 Tax=Paenibacillus sp. WC2504 TaxID=3461403 RepID=UPI004046164E
MLDRTLSKEECRLLLEAAIKLDPFFRQYYIMIYLLLSTGLRNTELRELKTSQIDFNRNLIYVGRGEKTSVNTVIMSKWLTHDFRSFLDHPHHRKWQEQGNEHVFFIAGKRLTRNGHLDDLIRLVCRKAGIRVVKAHWLRYTMAYSMHTEGFDFFTIHRKLRHKMIETTLKYLGLMNYDTRSLKLIISRLENPE